MDLQLAQYSALAAHSASDDGAIVVGLYGVPGCGKSFLLKQLKQELSQEHFEFYEGSEVIADMTFGGLDGFKRLEEPQQTQKREEAIEKIRKDSLYSGNVAVVAGHFMFWSEHEDVGRAIYTQGDLNTYTHIIYLNVDPEVVTRRCLEDKTRVRPNNSAAHIHRWQQGEMTQLRSLCYSHGILFSVVGAGSTLQSQVLMLLRDFRIHNEKYNLSQAEEMLDRALVAAQGKLKTVLVMDADRTLAAEDTGALFWKSVKDERKLKDLFSSPPRYSYRAFRQATLLYEEAVNESEFDSLCQEVARSVKMYAEIVSLLRRVGNEQHVGAIIITCGLHHVWDKVLDREGLSKTVAVIGGGRIANELVVTPAVKGALVARMRSVHHVCVWAFGDSPMDLEMLSKANRAIVVVGDQQSRSKTMDAALESAIDKDDLRAYQVLLPSNSSPRLDISKLPLVQLTDSEFVDGIFCRSSRYQPPQVFHATDKSAAKILMTSTRNAVVAGPALREAHSRIGKYLAIEYITDLIGVEEIPIQHVQGHDTIGHQLRHEKQTTIVALMRGGEPMALGVSETFPLAMLVHASHHYDIKPHHLKGQQTVVLVDSVVNSGKTVLQFVQHVRSFKPDIRIVVVTGVIQSQFVSSTELNRHTNLSLIALRLSNNKFTGSGTTDTGNRLFNTTHLT